MNLSIDSDNFDLFSFSFCNSSIALNPHGVAAFPTPNIFIMILVLILCASLLYLLRGVFISRFLVFLAALLLLLPKIKSEDIMSPEYLVINCRFWDGTSDYYDQLINLAEDYLDKTDEPTVTGFNNYIIHNN